MRSLLGTTTLVGGSPAVRKIRDDIDLAARSHAKVLILGETGVGKEVVARLIHGQSPCSQRRFVAVNCGGMPESLLESELFGHVRGSFTGAFRDKAGLVAQADGGTLFLDELGEMSLRMQAMLLRFAETGEFQRVGDDGRTARANVRLIAATNRDLRDAIAEKTFREDLYYRLDVIQIRISPLRDRVEDIEPLLQHYLQRAAADHQCPAPALSPEAVEVLRSYRWPGNVRELRNMTERLTLRCAGGTICPEDLPEEIIGVAAPHTPTPTRAAAVPVHLTPEEATAPLLTASRPDVVANLWARMRTGEDFWSAVHQRFISREITRADLLALVDRGLRETGGSYQKLLEVFNLPRSSYKRLHAFLYQHQCNLPVAPYRQSKREPIRSGRSSRTAKTVSRPWLMSA